MYVSAAQIRNALIDIAKEMGRPEFELYVIREVIEAVQNDSSHELKNIVLDRINKELNDLNIKKESDQAIRLKKIRSICTSDELKKRLAEESDLELKYIQYLVRGRYEIDNSLWGRIEPILDQMK